MHLLEPQEAHRVEQTEGKQHPSDSHTRMRHLGALLSASALEGLGQGSASKLPGEAGANQWGALGVVSCHFVTRARTQRVFSKSMAGTIPFLPWPLVWLAATQLKPTSLWPLRAHGTRTDPNLYPPKTESAGQSALPPIESLLQAPLRGESPQETGDSTGAGQSTSYPGLLFLTRMALWDQGKCPATWKRDQVCPR